MESLSLRVWSYVGSNGTPRAISMYKDRGVSLRPIYTSYTLIGIFAH